MREMADAIASELGLPGGTSVKKLVDMAAAELGTGDAGKPLVDRTRSIWLQLGSPAPP